MAHVILNLADGDRDAAGGLLRAGFWPVGPGERHGGALAAGDLALVHVGRPGCLFVGCAEIASPVGDVSPSQAEAGVDEAVAGVRLARAVLWPEPIPLGDAVRRIDPAATNPQVQANAGGFAAGVVIITPNEYAAVIALHQASASAD